MFRRRRESADPLALVDPGAVSRRFSGSVVEALDARRRYGDLLVRLQPGLVLDRLTDAGARLDAGVLAVWETARRATDLEHTLDALDPERVTADYKRAKRSAEDDTELEGVLAARFASVQRLLNTLDDTEDRLRLLEARLGAAVAHAAEVALGTDSAAAGALDAELVAVVDELGALRAALDELG
jgi:hypothetical protein